MNTSTSDGIHAIFYTFNARHVKIFRHTESCGGVVNITTSLKKVLKEEGSFSVEKRMALKAVLQFNNATDFKDNPFFKQRGG